MDTILITTLVFTGIGLIVGIGLLVTGKKFHVEKDERESEIRELLPGNNCGACGFAGCDAMAEAIAKGEAPVNGCPVGGSPVAEKIAAVMGTDAEAVERKTAFVRCKGTCEVTRNQGNYVGVKDCRSAALNGIRTTECDYGCLGFGSCVSICPEHAITVKDGVAVVNRMKCVGCGLCVRTCPTGPIELVPESKKVIVQCSNHDMGLTVKKVCSAGCIGCGICAKKCPSEAITVSGNLAHVNYENCVQCGECASACPVKVITG
jgi:Na+-translocating ferredoxin:NAD+ oxidoreductase RNF subunit RnfB